MSSHERPNTTIYNLFMFLQHIFGMYPAGSEDFTHFFPPETLKPANAARWSAGAKQAEPSGPPSSKKSGRRRRWRSRFQGRLRWCWWSYGDGSIPINRISIVIYPLVNSHNYEKSPFSMGKSTINTIFRGMNIHLPAILMWTKGVLLVLTHCHI